MSFVLESKIISRIVVDAACGYGNITADLFYVEYAMLL